MTDEQLETLARECGANTYSFRPDELTFTMSDLQTFVLRIEAQTIKSEQQGKQPHTDSAMNCALVFSNGKLIAVKT